MSPMLHDLSNEQAVITAIESNMFSFWTAYGHDRLDSERILRFATDVPHPLFNAAFRVQLTITQIQATIDETIAYFRARQTPFCWWTGPMTRPSDMGHHLQAHGLMHGGEIPGMAMLLADLPDSVPAPDDFEIVPVSTPHQLRQWSDVAAAANEMDASIFESLYQLELKRGLESTPRYLGLLAGEPAAAAALHLAEGVAGIYAVATVHKARSKGIGAAITLKPYLDARAQGYHVGILQASSMGYKMYQRLGFKKYCELGLYMG
ncbi:MAG: GNAT family N-acetyltransferase [Anaerolineae bacterium]